MAATRFINDRGLTARMTLVMFLLGALFVALVVGLMLAAQGSGYGAWPRSSGSSASGSPGSSGTTPTRSR